jgi:flavin-dependent dehydrogenase
MKPIIIIGAGPAGVCTALGLRNLGYEVILIAKKRVFNAVEGFSFRTLEGLKSAGCFKALKEILFEVKREAFWNNEKHDKNSEFLVKREDFDNALLEDAKALGVTVIKGSARISCIENSLVSIKKDGIQTQVKASFIVDARGRFAPRDVKIQSPATTAILLSFKKEHNLNNTSLKSYKNGWIWKASFDSSVNYIQLTTDTKNSKELMIQYLKEQKLSNLEDTILVNREASSYCSKNIITNNYIKVGDAACAVDPLSGNGVFQALSNSLLAPYIINTLIKGSFEDKNAAIDFFESRVDDIFYRYARSGREFYSQEKSYNTNFWKKRELWPDLISSHKESLEEPTIQNKAILKAPFIKAHEVVVTQSAPMGIWRMGRINIVPIVKTLLLEEIAQREKVLLELLNSLDFEESEEMKLKEWCKDNNLL